MTNATAAVKRYAKGAAVAYLAELERIKRQNGTARLEKSVVDAARDETHIWHRHFTWDDGVAAERYREEQARGLIRSVMLVRSAPKGGEGETRAYLHIRENGESHYMPQEMVIQDESRFLQVVRQIRTRLICAKNDMERWARLRPVATRLGAIVGTIDAIAADLKDRSHEKKKPAKKPNRKAKGGVKA